MSEPSKVRVYTGQEIDVQYELKRCIHAQECVQRLHAVFDNTKRPWIQPANDSANHIAETIEHCPTGALKYTRSDGASPEIADVSTTLRLVNDGPIYIRGDITLKKGDTTVPETRLALCRCGASENKPLCDNSHQKIDFKTEDTSTVKLEELGESPATTVETFTDGPMRISGSFSLTNAEGETIFQGRETYLCRCGHSANKPFCDNTHKKIGFQAE